MSEESDPSAPRHAPDAAIAASIGTPINLILLGLFVLILYLKLRPDPPSSLPKNNNNNKPILFRTYTPRSLRRFDGTADGPIYIAVRGAVYDVSPGRQFYGPGGPYANFAGRDASRGLAHQSFDADMLTADLDAPLDPLDDLTPDQLESLAGWEETFRAKYLRVGKLVAVGQEEEGEKRSAAVGKKDM